METNIDKEIIEPDSYTADLFASYDLPAFNTLDEDSEISNLLFVGTPGIGKTSLARIITNNVLKLMSYIDFPTV